MLAMFLQRPNELFKFDHVEWNVVFDEREVFASTVDDTVRLHTAYDQLQVEDICSWTRAVMAADNIIRTGQHVNMFTKQKKVNWGRDGF